MAASDFDLALHSPVKWMATERVLVEWYDSEAGNHRYLGTLSPNNHPANFTLAIGCDLAANALLITFHLIVKLRPSTSSKAKTMILVIPVEVLDSKHGEDALISETINVSDIPERTLSETRRAGLVESTGPQRMIRVQFRLKSPGYVIMPRASVGRPLKGTPLELLQNLQSLSRALSFDAYMKFNTYAQVGLDQAKQILPETSTPPIDVERMFNGLGAINVWDQYLLHKEKEQTSAVTVERQHSPAPPPYPDALPQPPAQPLSQISSPSVHLIKNTTQLLPSTPIVQVPRSDMSLSPLQLSSGSENLANMGYPSQNSSLRRDNIVFLDNSVSLNNPMARERSVISETPPVEHSRKRKAIDNPIAEDIIVADSLGCTTNHQHASSISQWLQWAWTWLPAAHEHFREQILSLGRAARDNNDHAFAEILAECTSLLMFMVIDRKYGAPTTVIPDETMTKGGFRYKRDLEADIKGVVLYINHIHSVAYIRLEHDLFHMAEAARGHGNRTFEQCKAMCISKACVSLQSQ